MRRIFITWELGGGLGHLMQILPLARALAVRGHQIFAALRDIPKAQAIFPEETIKLLQAPFLSQIVHSPIQRPLTFTHILHNIGFEDEEAMAAMCRAWRTLYDLVKPDLVLFDHSPTALLAARGHSFRKVPLGSGFCIPPDEHPLPSLRPWLKTDPETLQRDEDAMLARINRVLERFKQEPLDYISQLYTQVDRTLLLTFSELDHYAQRTAQDYWGVWSEAKGKPPKWPSTSGRHIYAYLKNFEALSDLLALLKKLSHPTIIVSDAIPEDVRK